MIDEEASRLEMNVKYPFSRTKPPRLLGGITSSHQHPRSARELCSATLCCLRLAKQQPVLPTKTLFEATRVFWGWVSLSFSSLFSAKCHLSLVLGCSQQPLQTQIGSSTHKFGRFCLPRLFKTVQLAAVGM